MICLLVSGLTIQNKVLSERPRPGQCSLKADRPAMQGLYSFSYHSHALQADHSLFDSDDHRTQSQFEQSISISDF